MALDLNPIKARDAAATPGPWEADGSEIVVSDSRKWIGETCRLHDDFSYDLQSSVDAEFVAKARTDVPALAAEVEQLRADLGIANEATLVLLARATEAEATVQRLIAQADGAARRVAELEVRSLADEVRAAQEATRMLRDLAPVRDGEEPDPDEEPCRCCAGPGFGRGEHLHDEQTCEHPCCPARDE